MTARRLAWAPDIAGRARLEVGGWPEHELDALRRLSAAELAARFAVLPAAAAGTDAATPMSGSFALVNNTLRFVPRHPVAAGVEYAVLDGERLLGTIARTPSARRPVTTVSGIFPSGAQLPRNALRLYVHFSAPMSEGGAASNVRLMDPLSGAELAGALLPGPELWDPARTRLTVLLDPARLKRGLVSHDQAGYPLTEGAEVALVVGQGMRDAAGTALAASAARQYTVAGDVRERLDPLRWATDVPAPGTRAPLRVRAERPLDHALALRCLTVVDAAHREVAGERRLCAGDREWRFTPAAPWASAGYRLVVDPALEDIAGNSVSRVFDRDLDDPLHDPVPSVPVEVPLNSG